MKKAGCDPALINALEPVTFAYLEEQVKPQAAGFVICVRAEGREANV